MKKMFSLAVIMALFCVPAFAAVPMSGPYPDGSRLTLATGGDQGEYYAFGTALAEMASRKTSSQFHIVASSGAMKNVEALFRNNAKLAFIQSDVGFYATRGTRLFTTKMDNFSTVAVLYPEPVQIITLTPEIERIEQLRGKTVSVGAEGSGTYFNAVDVLEAYGMDIDTDINPVYESFASSVEDLKSGKIDAAFIVAGTPTPAVAELAKAGKIFLVSFDDRHITKVELPKSTYGTDDNDVTVAVNAVVVARDDVKMEDVYNFMYGVFENLDVIGGVNSRAKYLSLKSAASYPAVPYHPGAVKYLGEKGILVSGKK